MERISVLGKINSEYEDTKELMGAPQAMKWPGSLWKEPAAWKPSGQGGFEVVRKVAGSQAMGCMPVVNDDGYDAVDEMVIDDEEHHDRPVSSTLQVSRSPMMREEKKGAGCMMSKLPKGPTVAVNRGADDGSVNASDRITRSKSGHLPSSISHTTSDGTCGHTSTTDHHTTDHHTTDHESSYCSCQAADEKDCKCEEKSEKWRKRDKNKHLAGERSRRQKRMTRLYELRDLLTPFEEKATVNNILQQAAKQIREIMAEEARTGSKVSISKPSKATSGRSTSRSRRASLPKKDAQPARPAQPPPRSSVVEDIAASAFHAAAMNSTTTAVFVLDLQHKVVEASSAMATMIGCNSGSAAGMHPYAFIDRDDFDSLVLEEESLRSAISFKGPCKGKPRMFDAEARFKTGPGMSASFPIEVTVSQDITIVLLLPSTEPRMQTSPPPEVATPQAKVLDDAMTVRNNTAAPVWFGGPIPLEGTFVLVESFRLPDLMSLLGCTAHQNNMYAWEACQACWPAEQWEMFGASDVVVDEILIKMQLESDSRAINRQEMAITDGGPKMVLLRSDIFSLDGIACVVSTETGDEAVCHTSLVDPNVIQQWYSWRCAGGNSICLSKRWTASPLGLTCDMSLSYAGSQVPNARLYFQRLPPS